MKKKINLFLIKGRWFVLVLVALLGSYVYGTFNPNPYTLKDIVEIEHQKSVEKMNDLGLIEPTFEYTDDETFIQSVEKCIDYVNFVTEMDKRIPNGLIIAMAGVESAWGTSRFAIKGNNLFGIRTWDPKSPQLKPLDLPDARFGVKVYKTKCDSVRDVVRILNNHPAYSDFRSERDTQYNEKYRDWDTLVPLVAPWSTNEAYGDIILSTIKKRGF